MTIEGKGGAGAIPLNRIHRFYNRYFKRHHLVGQIALFDWEKGYDVRDTIGPIKIKNQGINDSCGGQSGSYFLEIQRKLQGIQESELSAKSVYAPIAYPGGGTTIPSLEAQIATKGANFEETVPSYDPQGNPLPELQMEDKSWQTVAISQDALTRAGYTPINVPTDIESVASAIQQYGAVIIEITGQNNGSWTSSIPQPPNKGNPNPLWRHFLCLCGAKIIGGVKCIIALESMGTSWGDSGVQNITETYFDSGYVNDAFTFAYDKSLVYNPTLTGWAAVWQAVSQWFRSQAWYN